MSDANKPDSSERETGADLKPSKNEGSESLSPGCVAGLVLGFLVLMTFTLCATSFNGI